MTTSSLLVVGSVAFDDIETPFGRRQQALGGSAIYFSLAASHFTDVSLVGVAGEDYPLDVIRMLQSHRIDTSGLVIAKGQTFRWGGRYHQNLNQRDTLYTHLNVFSDFKPFIPAAYRSIPFVFLGNIQPQLQLEVLSQMASPRFVALDTMNLWIKTTRTALDEVIRKVNLLVINDSELQELTGEYNLPRALELLHGQGLRYIIIKRGEHGAYLSWGNGLFYSPAYPVQQAIDPTGAGDSFAGGLMGYLATQPVLDISALRRATVYACALGSFCVEYFSIDRLLTVDRTQIEDRYRSLRKMVKI